MKFWQKKVRGWIVPFWFTDTPLFSKRFAYLRKKEKLNIVKQIHNERVNK